MEPELARHIVRAAFRSAGELQNLLPLLKAHASPAEYETYRRAIATTLATIGDQITNPTLSAHPALVAEVEASIAAYGQLL